MDTSSSMWAWCHGWGEFPEFTLICELLERSLLMRFIASWHRFSIWFSTSLQPISSLSLAKCGLLIFKRRKGAVRDVPKAKGVWSPPPCEFPSQETCCLEFCHLKNYVSQHVPRYYRGGVVCLICLHTWRATIVKKTKHLSREKTEGRASSDPTTRVGLPIFARVLNNTFGRWETCKRWWFKTWMGDTTWQESHPMFHPLRNGKPIRL